MKIKTSELSASFINLAVAIADKVELDSVESFKGKIYLWVRDKCNSGRLELFSPATDWEQGGSIIEREKISLLRCDDEYFTDSEGFTTSQRIPVWFAEHGGGHSLQEDYGSQGDYQGACFHVPSEGQYGETSLIAAMRCYVACKLGESVDIPEELLK